MEPPPAQNDSLTPSQRQAVAARGNVLVMAGAGTGKTHTLVERCLNLLCVEKVSLNEILIVTFTEAAATEMRQRLRAALEKKSRENPDPFFSEQLALFDAAHIGTLHGFCRRLIREHFYELGLDPQIAMLDEGEARQLAGEILAEQFQSHYENEDEFSLAAQKLIQIYGNGRDEKIRAFILRLHHYSQTRPDAAGWLAEQVRQFSVAQPAGWSRWLLAAIAGWRDEWLPVLEHLHNENEKAAELAGILSRLPDKFSRAAGAEIMEQIAGADATASYPRGKAGKLRPALGHIFEEARFLADLAPVKNGNDPLAEDWTWVRGYMQTLLRLAQEFAEKFSERKRADGVLDFHDLEQFALKLLWNFSAGKPTAVAETWRKKLRFVFVDEYQDINAAQDKIITALARDRSAPVPGAATENETAAAESPHVFQKPDIAASGDGRAPASAGNRFLVGDVKQSIYRFRLADPKIFRDYSKNWRSANGQVIPLSENFRSRETLLNFINSIFEPIMREEIGGVDYDAEAKLKFGSPAARESFSAANDPSPRAELQLRIKPGRDAEAADDELADLADADKEARLIALRLKRLAADNHGIYDDEKKIFRPVEWRDMAVLLRAPAGKAEIFAKEFARAGIPLVVERGGFFDSSEILDLLSLLQLLDNPLQDVPCIAVLRSPLVGLSLDELAEIRLAAKDKHFWTALNAIQNEKIKIKNGLQEKAAKFLGRFSRWRKLAKQQSLSECLEAVLSETFYADWLKSQPRGAQRHANVAQFLNLAQKFDQFQRQGLFRFLKFIEAQRETGVEPEVAPVADKNAVRLMSIHQSKGLEFPVVALPDLSKKFNEQDLHGEIILDESFGLGPRVKPPQTGSRYPSLPHWLAQRRQRRELRGEELRLFYVALTRARDTLILSGSISRTKWETLWTKTGEITPQKILAAKSYADWLGLWFAQQAIGANETEGEAPDLRWRIAEDAELVGEKNLMEAPEMELPPLDDETAQKLRGLAAWRYRFEAATGRAAKSSVTALRRQAADELDDEAKPLFPGRRSGRPKLSAADTGTAHHKFLQHVSLEKAGEPAALAAEAERLTGEKIISADERAALNLKNIAAFWNSDLGQKIRAQPPALVKRELPFTARFSPQELSEILGTKPAADLENEFVVVQGVADLMVLLPEEIWLVDFKTDEVRAEELAGKTKAYAPQLKLYAGALAKIYSRPVTNCRLHFLSAGKSEQVKI